jgi:hypothetical protein
MRNVSPAATRAECHICGTVGLLGEGPKFGGDEVKRHPGRSPDIYGWRRTIWVTAVLVFGMAAQGSAQLQVATLHGIVLDSERHPVASATIVLRDSARNAVASTITRNDGSFEIKDVVPGSYLLRVELQGAPVLAQPIVVRGSLPVELTLRTGFRSSTR